MAAVDWSGVDARATHGVRKGYLRRLVTSFVEWNRARKAFDDLSKISDHHLNDIGLSRGELRDHCFGREGRK